MVPLTKTKALLLLDMWDEHHSPLLRGVIPYRRDKFTHQIEVRTPADIEAVSTLGWFEEAAAWGRKQQHPSGSTLVVVSDEATRYSHQRALSDEIRALGPVEGRVLMVHASLRAVGPVEGGAATVIEAIRSAIGANGTMLMMIAADDDGPFDRLSSEADEDNGVLAEIFRTYPGVEVNDHPACRFAAIGPDATVLLKPQPIDDYYGAGSPLERLVDLDGLVLRLGADLDTVTLTHYAENIANVPDKRRVQRTYNRADTGDIVVTSIDDSDGIADWEGGDYFRQVLVDFIASGRAAVGPVGGCTAELLDARNFVGFAVDWLEQHLG